MRIYHDWEFLDTGVDIKPISVGMVTEDEDELYFEFADAPWSEVYKHEWLKANAVPHLSKDHKIAAVTGQSSGVVRSKLGIAAEVYDFLKNAQKADPSSPIELWGWFSAYDHVCLAQLFGRMIDLPPFCPMWTNDLRQEFYRLGNPSGPEQTSGLHHALEDAKFIKTRHEWLMEYQK